MCPNFRFLHAADLHLDSPLLGLTSLEQAPETIRGATRQALDRLVDLAREEKVAFVLLAGDIYDGSWRDYSTGLFFVDRMARLGRDQIRVVMISGNHDADSQITNALRLPDNVHRLDTNAPQTLRFKDLAVAIHGQGYHQRAERGNLARAYPQALAGHCNIGLLHTALGGRSGHEPYAPCTLDDLRAHGYDYWALGHVHQREVVLEADPWVVFPGNLQGRHIRESGPKGATLVTVRDGHVSAVEHRSLDVVRWRRLELSCAGCLDAEEILHRSREALQQSADEAEQRLLALRLTLTGTTAAHFQLTARPSHWQAELEAQALAIGDLWLERLDFCTRPPGDFQQVFGDTTPQATLIEAVTSLDCSPEGLRSLLPDLDALHNRLGRELRDGITELLPTDDGAMARLRDDIRDLLVARLLERR
ncbi:MAG: hypothetical protein BWK76_03805 [Desulfobulbaceae bacterium A2]|nr:MAG: hypothetical protein BWK76_03805 [Desulfobulbaceae bacterium A2]